MDKIGMGVSPETLDVNNTFTCFQNYCEKPVTYDTFFTYDNQYDLLLGEEKTNSWQE
jgi:hypothetical protein